MNAIPTILRAPGCRHTPATANALAATTCGSPATGASAATSAVAGSSPGASSSAAASPTAKSGTATLAADGMFANTDGYAMVSTSADLIADMAQRYRFVVARPGRKAAATTTTVDGCTLTPSGDLTADMASMPTATITRNRQPVDILHPYLDTRSHLTGFRSVDLAFALLHPREQIRAARADLPSPSTPNWRPSAHGGSASSSTPRARCAPHRSP
jgi:hypothetical protein